MLPDEDNVVGAVAEVVLVRNGDELRVDGTVGRTATANTPEAHLIDQ